MKRAITTALLIALTGCASVEPYATVGLGYQIEGQTDYWLKTDRSWQCDHNPKAIIEAGVELPNNWKIAYNHQSWVRCGRPFNRRPEVYQDDIRILKTWGGAK